MRKHTEDKQHGLHHPAKSRWWSQDSDSGGLNPENSLKYFPTHICREKSARIRTNTSTAEFRQFWVVISAHLTGTEWG